MPSVIRSDGLSIYFAFSDENGAYKRRRNKKFLQAHPWYIRSTVVFPAGEWKSLESRFRSIKNSYELPLDKEIKWSFAWSLMSHDRTRKPITTKDKYYFLRDYDPERLQHFLRDSVALLTELSEATIILTVTNNTTCQNIRVEPLLRMHLQEAMQRLEMDMQRFDQALCVLFVDPVSEEKDKALREAYAELYRRGDYIEEYSCIKDSLNIEHSHHSVGIQMADYVAGAAGSILNGRPLGATIYRDSISKIVRRDSAGNIGGYGLREVPTNARLREELVRALNESSV